MYIILLIPSFHPLFYFFFEDQNVVDNGELLNFDPMLRRLATLAEEFMKSGKNTKVMKK